MVGWLPSFSINSFLQNLILFCSFLRSQETGFPVGVRVRIAERSFHLHKVWLRRNSGYFKEKLKDETTDEVDLPPDFPGGAEAFELTALLMYGHGALVEEDNVAALRCATDFLEMRSHCQGLDMYLNQVVLQSWHQTVLVLSQARGLLPWAEDVLLVTRCIETVAFMACMEILDPEQGREQALQLHEPWPWRDAAVGDVVSRDVWILDVIALPFAFFKRVIASLRRQAIEEKYVCTIILLYAQAHKESAPRLADLLPDRGVPVGFYLYLLATGTGRNKSVEKKVASMLHLAQPEDLAGIELAVVERIFLGSDTRSPAVARLWDQYLTNIAADPDLPCTRLITLIQTIIPHSSRHTHDYLFAALDLFFRSHSNLPQEEKGSLCKYLHCQKLSPPVCIGALRNEEMPLRLIMQALFVHAQHMSMPPGHNKSYESTAFRIQNLETELQSLKRTLHLQQSKNHQNSGCIATLTFTLHRKYAYKVRNILHQLLLFGGGKSKRNRPASASFPN
ncbi:LOW QUALITY PROTEIN: BTB/POZ domain-containing protein At5g48130 [Salvia splendens]|uniref:LOW QUALITY PROTEIN: BTB/POZ domain-containing protein At5g48130 n=1 Tax=Salvia splendens TaxID=180675 RepID=UPI001C276A75|nr:LOW QUALITY PROTEIN: BTB/POZ domain-containing protein At5g48130 [Salvia splendens]